MEQPFPGQCSKITVRSRIVGYASTSVVVEKEPRKCCSGEAYDEASKLLTWAYDIDGGNKEMIKYSVIANVDNRHPEVFMGWLEQMPGQMMRAIRALLEVASQDKDMEDYAGRALHAETMKNDWEGN
jgi:hypothetical protein